MNAPAVVWVKTCTGFTTGEVQRWFGFRIDHVICIGPPKKGTRDIHFQVLTMCSCRRGASVTFYDDDMLCLCQITR